MTAEVRCVRPEDAPEICDFLHVHMSSRISREKWQRILTPYPWRLPGSDLGCIAVDGGRIVGFFGVMHTIRDVDGTRAHIANLTTWYLLKPYRGTGIGMPMFRAVAGDPDVTYTNFTSDWPILRIFDRLDFGVLDDRRYVWRRKEREHSTIDVVRDRDAIRAALAPAERALVDDHAEFNVATYLLRAAEGSCLVMLAVMMKGAEIAYHDVLHLSDRAVFARHAQEFANDILPETKALLAVDARLLHGTKPGGECVPLKVPRYFRSAQLAPWQVDFLYSEVILLDLKLF